jgi:hypothetical protein
LIKAKALTTTQREESLQRKKEVAISAALAELEFLKSLWGLGTKEEEGYHTGPPGYIGWRNSFLGIDSGAPYTFKNTGSERRMGFGVNSDDIKKQGLLHFSSSMAVDNGHTKPSLQLVAPIVSLK